MPNIRPISLSLVGTLLFAALPLAGAQTAEPAHPAEPRTPAEIRRASNQEPVKTFFLHAGGGADYQNEILTALRQILDPSVKLFPVRELNAIVVRGTPESIATAQQIISELDKLRPNYKLTFSVAELESGKIIGVQHFAVDAVANAHVKLRNSSKVPFQTGASQFTFLDLGITFDATLEQGVSGMRLSSKVDQTAASDSKQAGGITEPVIRDTVLEGTSTIVVGKPLSLGSFDIPGSTRHLDVEVLLELAK